LKGSLTCLKTLRHGADGFTSLRRKACCWPAYLGSSSTIKPLMTSLWPQ
jgi:hypothetical protein